MALSLSPMAPKKPAKKKPVTLQMEQQSVAKPVALQPTPAAPTPAAPTPPRETMPAAKPPIKPPATLSIGGALPKPQPTPTGAGGATGMVGGFGASPPPDGGYGSGGPSWSGSWSGQAGGGGSGGANIPVTGPGTRGDADQDGIPDNQEEGYNPFAGWTPTLPPGWKASEVAAWSDATGGKVAPPAGAPDEPASNEELNAQIRSLMEDLVSGRGMDVNTAEEEALIRELMQDRLGQGLVEQRAKMGRAGFGASGALAAMEGDVRRQAGQQATQETLALRRQAEQEAIRNALQAVGVDIGVRGEARRAAFDEEFLNALKASLGIVDEVGGEAPEESGLSTDNPANARVQGNSVLDPVTGAPYEIRSSANPNDVKTRVLNGSNGVSYAIYLDSERSTPGNNVLYAVRG